MASRPPRAPPGITWGVGSVVSVSECGSFRLLDMARLTPPHARARPSPVAAHTRGVLHQPPRRNLMHARAGGQPEHIRHQPTNLRRRPRNPRRERSSLRAEHPAGAPHGWQRDLAVAARAVVASCACIASGMLAADAACDGIAHDVRKPCVDGARVCVHVPRYTMCVDVRQHRWHTFRVAGSVWHTSHSRTLCG
jgi:hypothetical protein